MKFDLETAKKLWAQLGDIPVTEDDDFVIEEDGTVFEKGTDKFEVWHWFEETFDVSVATDLMGSD